MASRSSFGFGSESSESDTESPFKNRERKIPFENSDINADSSNKDPSMWSSTFKYGVTLYIQTLMYTHDDVRRWLKKRDRRFYENNTQGGDDTAIVLNDVDRRGATQVFRQV